MGTLPCASGTVNQLKAQGSDWKMEKPAVFAGTHTWLFEGWDNYANRIASF